MNRYEFELHLSPERYLDYYRGKVRSIVVQCNVNNLFDKVTDQGAQYRYPRYTEPRQIISKLTAQC